MSKRIPLCHPDKPHKAKSLCATCYTRNLKGSIPWKDRVKMANCHPDRKHKALGLCLQCYRLSDEVRSRARSCQQQARAAGKYKKRERLHHLKTKSMPKRQAQLIASRKKWGNSKKGREWIRDYLLQYNFDIDSNEYDKLFKLQSGKCKICGAKCPTGKRLAVDHDHKHEDLTGEIFVRALLCTRCNPGLGFFRDNPKLLRAAADYIEFYSRALRSITRSLRETSYSTRSSDTG